MPPPQLSVFRLGLAAGRPLGRMVVLGTMVVMLAKATNAQPAPPFLFSEPVTWCTSALPLHDCETNQESDSHPLELALGDLWAPGYYDPYQDGWLDVAVANNFTSTIAIFRNTRTWTIPSEGLELYLEIPVAGIPYGVEIADVDADGAYDIVVSGDFTSGPLDGPGVAIIRNNVDGTFATPQYIVPVAQPGYPFVNGQNGLAVADIDPTAYNGVDFLFMTQMPLLGTPEDAKPATVLLRRTGVSLQTTTEHYVPVGYPSTPVQYPSPAMDVVVSRFKNGPNRADLDVVATLTNGALYVLRNNSGVLQNDASAYQPQNPRSPRRRWPPGYLRLATCATLFG